MSLPGHDFRVRMTGSRRSPSSRRSFHDSPPGVVLRDLVGERARTAVPLTFGCCRQDGSPRQFSCWGLTHSRGHLCGFHGKHCCSSAAFRQPSKVVLPFPDRDPAGSLRITIPGRAGSRAALGHQPFIRASAARSVTDRWQRQGRDGEGTGSATKGPKAPGSVTDVTYPPGVREER